MIISLKDYTTTMVHYCLVKYDHTVCTMFTILKYVVNTCKYYAYLQCFSINLNPREM